MRSHTGRVMDAIRARRSVRVYGDGAIDRETVTTIVGAARLAPSSRNGQPGRYVIVTDAEDRAALAAVGKEGGKGSAHVAGAPVAIALIARDPGTEEGRQRVHFDLGQASMSMQLAAVAYGVGACPVAVDDESMARKVLDVTDEWLCPYLLTFGWPRGPYNVWQLHDRLPIEEVCTWLTSRAQAPGM